ncbi:MAG: hypothetical protein IJ454_02350, partial [Clostridia bacterium]|nr:hypothetical protein [Clostridia bacterium]
MKKIFLLILSLTLVCTSMYVPAFAAENEGYGILYVSPDGRDSNDGSIDRPLKTIAAAQRKVRTMKGSNYPKGITVYVRGGDYNMVEPIV